MDPVEIVTGHLVEHGFTENQARNILGSVQANSQEKLLENAEKFVHYCTDIKAQYDVIIEAVCEGFMAVGYEKGGELYIGLKTDEFMDGISQ